MLTPLKIQELAEPIEGIYINMSNELLVNIGKHISSPTWTHTAAWEVQKLSELGQLTQENAAIINKWAKKLTPEMRKTMEATRKAALDKLEETLSKAAEEGYITPPVADSTTQIFEDYAAQAIDKLNMVNTTMLNSSVEMFQQMVLDTAQSVEEAQTRNRSIIQSAEEIQGILNEAAGSVIQGTKTGRTALKDAVERSIDKFSAEGLTGFVDRAGRSWTPEAYVNMDIRTTVHNTAIQATRARMEDYNTNVFQISSHSGARPLCYPYQGKYYSWDDTSGEVTLGDGRRVHYEPISSTSYGEPAGIFGINCGHRPIVVIPGYSIPHGEDNIQPKALNDKVYQESQKQRALERKIRNAKRTVEMGDDSQKAKDKIKAAQAEMRAFIAETGRTRRYEREQVYTGKKK